MDGLMMDYQLNVPAHPAPSRRAVRRQRDREPPARQELAPLHVRRLRLADEEARRRRSAKLGLEDGDRVGTFMWNHSQHLETYMGSPVGGFVTHTLNLRLHPDDNTYIATHGGDRVLIVDKVLWPLAEPVRRALQLRARDRGRRRPDARRRDRLRGALADADESAFAYRDIPENAAAAMCYTSGTTGRPKGVLYSHRAIAIHALTVIGCLGMHADDVVPPGRADVPRERVVLPVLLHDDRRQAGLPRPAPRSRQPARGLRSRRR